MNIRTLTFGLNAELPIRSQTLLQVGEVSRLAKTSFENEGFRVQTIRLAIQPFSDLMAGRDPSEAVFVATTLERGCLECGIEYVSLGTIMASNGLDLIHAVPDVLASTKQASISVTVAARPWGVHLPAVRATAKAIKANSQISLEQGTNLRFAALANCPPNIPFFPSAFHDGRAMTLTIGLESAGVVGHVLGSGLSLAEVQTELVATFEEAAKTLEAIAIRVTNEHGVLFGGLDFSTAPFPTPELSIAGAVEKMGVSKFGASGTLFGVALITDALRKSRFRKAGFSGVFLPIMEDCILAARNEEKLFTLDSLLLYSAVCGAGLDTIPLPGAIETDELASIILDVATLALVLDKPLSARLVPIRGRKAGERVESVSPYFAETTVVSTKEFCSSRIVQREETVKIGSSSIPKGPTTDR